MSIGTSREVHVMSRKAIRELEPRRNLSVRHVLLVRPKRDLSVRHVALAAPWPEGPLVPPQPASRHRGLGLPALVLPLIVMAVALSVCAVPAWGRTPAPVPGLEGRLRSIEKRPHVSRTMALLAKVPGRALLIQRVGSRALLLTARGFAFAKQGRSPLDGSERPRHKGFMLARGWHVVYRQPLFSLSRGWRRAIDTRSLERSVSRIIWASRRDLAQNRIQEWNPVTGDNGSALVLVKRSLVGL